MVGRIKLSNDDVYALISGLNNGVLAEDTCILTGKDYGIFVFGTKNTGISGAIYTLKRINDRIKRRFKSIILSLLRIAPVDRDVSQKLKGIALLLPSKSPRVETERNDTLWAEHLEESVLDMHLRIAPRIAEPSIALVDLLKLNVGTVIEIPAFSEIPLCVEGQPFFTGTIGERNGKMAVSLN